MLLSTSDRIRTWHVEDGDMKLGAEMRQHDGDIYCTEWTHNNKMVVSCGQDGHIIVTAADSGKVILSYQPTTKPLPAIHLSSSSKYIICGGTDGRIRMFGLRKGADMVLDYPAHRDPITCILFSPAAENYIVSGDQRGTIVISDTQSRKIQKKLKVPLSQHAVRAIKYSIQKQHILGATYDDGTIRLWNTTTGAVECEFLKAHRAAATSLAFSPRNKLLLMTGGLDKRVMFFDIEKQATIRWIDTASPVTAVAMNYEGNTLAVGTSNGEIMIFNLKNGSSTPISTVAGHSLIPARWLAFQHRPRSKDKVSSSKTVAAPPNVVEVPQEVRPQVRGSENQEPHAFEQSMFQHMIDERMDELRSQVSREVQNLHLDMLRQFQLQQNEMTNVLTTLSNKLNRLSDQVAELRQENQDLQTIY